MTEIEKQKAEAEIAKWFWQPAEGHNFRYKYAVRTLTRYYEMVTPAADTLKIIIEYLRTQELVGEISLLGKKVDFGTGWKAKDAWYQTAAGDEFANTKQNKVRVYQTLALAPDSDEGDGPYTVEDGCQYKVEHTFYWNVEELPTLPESSSGVQYTMQSVFRDNETGFFSCIIEKRERVQQDVALYDTAKTAFEERQEEQHIGVKQAAVATTGQAASVSGGVIVQRKVTKNPDCTSDVQNEVITEVEAQNSLVETRKTLRGKVTVTKHRNQAAALSTTGMADGETRRSEKTPGKLFDNTTEIAAADTGAKDISHGCQKTPVVHTDTSVESVPVTQQEDQHVTAEANKEKEVSYRKNEDGVTKDKTTVVREYTPTEGEGGSKETSVSSVVEHGEHILAADVPTLPATTTANQVVEVDIRPNDHGSYSTTKRTTTYSEKTGGGSTNSGNGVVTTTTTRKDNSTDTPTETAAVNKVVEIEETPNDHGSKTTVKRVTTYTPTEGEGGSKETSVETEVEHGEHVLASDVPTLPATPTANQVVEVDVRPNDHGSFSTTKRKTTYKKKTGSGTTNSGNGAVITTIERKENSTDETPTETAAPNKVVEIEETPNDHGSKTSVKRVTTYTPTEGEGGSKETSVETEVEHGEHVLASDVPTLPATPTANQVVEVDVRPNDHGSYSTTKRTTTYSEKTGGGSTNSGNGVVTTTTTRKDNSTDTPTETAAVNKVVEIEETPNDHGSKTTVKRVTTYTPTEGEGGSKSSKVETEVEHGEHVLAANVPTLPSTPTANQVVKVDIRPNDHGSYSTTKRTTTYSERDVSIEWAGNGGTYKYRSFSHLATKPTVTTPTGGTASATISQNTEGTYDGTITTFTPDGGGGASAGVIFEQTKTVTVKEQRVLPGGRVQERTVTITLTRGYAALATCYAKWAESGEGYKNYVPFIQEVGERNGRYQSVDVVFGGWSYVSQQGS